MDRPVAYHGERFTICYAVDGKGRCPAQDFIQTLDRADQQKVLSLFKFMGDHGRIPNTEKFRLLGDGLSEFKSFQIRMPCRFEKDGLIIVSHGFVKKRDDTPRSEIERARRILDEDRERGQAPGPKRVK